MTEHKIAISFSEKRLQNLQVIVFIRRCIRTALKMQKVHCPCEVNVYITDDKGIHEINRIQRNIDRPTDVLSFPMFEFSPGAFPEDVSGITDPETGFLPLGDMAISLERAKAQAEEYGHSVKREVGYLTVHSILHLLGYDHLDEGPMKAQMREREEIIMVEISLNH